MRIKELTVVSTFLFFSTISKTPEANLGILGSRTCLWNSSLPVVDTIIWRIKHIVTDKIGAGSSL